jgi:hypothetical protein
MTVLLPEASVSIRARRSAQILSDLQPTPALLFLHVGSMHHAQQLTAYAAAGATGIGLGSALFKPGLHVGR